MEFKTLDAVLKIDLQFPEFDFIKEINKNLYEDVIDHVVGKMRNVYGINEIITHPDFILHMECETDEIDNVQSYVSRNLKMWVLYAIHEYIEYLNENCYTMDEDIIAEIKQCEEIQDLMEKYFLKGN